jgi:hypothetical protein
MNKNEKLIKECKKHLRDTESFKHEYKKDIRKLITALSEQLILFRGVGEEQTFCEFCKEVPTKTHGTLCSECRIDIQNC